MILRVGLCVVFILCPLITIDLAEGKGKSNKPYSFVVIGHIRGNDNGVPLSFMDELIEKIRKLKPDMVFLTGDMIYGDQNTTMADPKILTEDWDYLDTALGTLGVPIYRAPGNHDLHDPVSRDIYFARYGEPPQAFSYKGSRFLLLNTVPVPKGSEHRVPHRKGLVYRKHFENQEQIEFLRNELNGGEQHNHVFLFMHHLFWWDEKARWWDEVHPLLKGSNVYAVFGGDRGPIGNFSHLERDGIHYLQSVVQEELSIDTVRTLLKLGKRSMNLSTFLHVLVDGAEVHIDVETVGALSSKGFSPTVWNQVIAQDISNQGFVVQIWDLVNTPRRLMAVWALLMSCFVGGIVAMYCWVRFRTRV